MDSRVWKIAVACFLAFLACSTPYVALAQGPGGGGTPTEAPVMSGPTTDLDGNYTISWTSVAHGVYYKLEENPSTGVWSSVPHSAKYSANISGNADGTYFYRVKGCVGGYCGPWSDSLPVGVGSDPVVPEPESYADQLAYQYEARTGDFDGNGHTDILVDRLTPGDVDGSMQTVIIEGGPNGASVVVPTPSELNAARSYPTDPDLTLGGTDKNFDGFADLLITGLGALGSPSFSDESLYTMRVRWVLWHHQPFARFQRRYVHCRTSAAGRNVDRRHARTAVTRIRRKMETRKRCSAVILWSHGLTTAHARS